jgi:hypothetical protein
VEEQHLTTASPGESTGDEVEEQQQEEKEAPGEEGKATATTPSQASAPVSGSPLREDPYSYAGSTVTIVATLFADQPQHERGRQVLIQAFNASVPPVYYSCRAADLTEHAPLDNLQEGFRAVLQAFLAALVTRREEHDAVKAQRSAAQQKKKKTTTREGGDTPEQGAPNTPAGQEEPVPVPAHAQPSLFDTPAATEQEQSANGDDPTLVAAQRQDAE